MSSRAFQGLGVQELPLFAETVPLSVPAAGNFVISAVNISPLGNIGLCDDSESMEREGSLIVGVAWALALEAAAALGVCGIWNFCHLLH